MIQGPSPKGAGALFDTTTIYGEHTDQVFRYETFKIFRNGTPRTGHGLPRRMFRRRRHRQPRPRLRIRSVQATQGGVLRRPESGPETPARLPFRSQQGAGLALLRRHDHHPVADALGPRQAERRIRAAQREAPAADGTIPDHHLLAIQCRRRADLQRHAGRREARHRGRRPRVARRGAARYGTFLDLQGLVGLHRDARGDARRRTAVHLRRDRVPRPDRKAQDDQRAHHVRKTPREVLDPLQGRPRGRGSRGHRGRLPDLLARMRHAALAQGGRLQPGEIPGLRQEQSPAGDQQASQEPGFHHRGQQDHRGQSRRHALRGRRVYPRLLRALRNLEGARRGALVLQG